MAEEVSPYFDDSADQYAPLVNDDHTHEPIQSSDEWLLGRAHQAYDFYCGASSHQPWVDVSPAIKARWVAVVSGIYHTM